MQAVCRSFLTLTINGHYPLSALLVGRVNEYREAICDIAHDEIRAPADYHAGAFLRKPRYNVLLSEPQLVRVGLTVVGSARERVIVQAVRYSVLAEFLDVFLCKACFSAIFSISSLS